MHQAEPGSLQYGPFRQKWCILHTSNLHACLISERVSPVFLVSRGTGFPDLFHVFTRGQPFSARPIKPCQFVAELTVPARKSPPPDLPAAPPPPLTLSVNSLPSKLVLSLVLLVLALLQEISLNCFKPKSPQSHLPCKAAEERNSDDLRGVWLKPSPPLTRSF